jgi:siroheme synthase-like protein
MKTFPIMMDLRDQLTVVVGGGSVGLRKATSLRKAGARVKLVATRIDEGADLSGLDVIQEPYRKEMLAGALLVFACTDDRELNSRVWRDAHEIGALVNVADVPDECDFYLPATVWNGEVVVAIGTGGAAPALSAWLRRRLTDELPQRLGEFAAALEELRTEVKATVSDMDRRMTIMKQLVSEETYEGFLADGPAALRAKLDELLAG